MAACVGRLRVPWQRSNAVAVAAGLRKRVGEDGGEDDAFGFLSDQFQACALLSLRVYKLQDKREWLRVLSISHRSGA